MKRENGLNTSNCNHNKYWWQRFSDDGQFISISNFTASLLDHHGRPGYIEMKRKRLPITTARGLNEVQTEEIEELRGCSFRIKNIVKTGSK